MDKYVRVYTNVEGDVTIITAIYMPFPPTIDTSQIIALKGRNMGVECVGKLAHKVLSIIKKTGGVIFNGYFHKVEPGKRHIQIMIDAEYHNVY